MANVFHYKNVNKEKYVELISKAKRVRNIGIGILVGMILLSFINPYSLMWCYSIFIGAVAIVFMDYKYCSLMTEADVLASGLSGENKVFNTLSQLPDEYVVVTNVPISYEGNRSEVDALVMSPYGMFVVEVKNHKGLIEGNCSDRVWKQYKNGRFERTMRNPIFQMRNQKRILFGMNEMRKLSVPINGLVVFPSATDVNVGAEEVLYGLDGLNSFLMEKNKVRVKPIELCRVIKAYGVDLNKVIYGIYAFYKENCPELLEGIGG